MNTAPESTDRELAERRAKYLTGLIWHVGAFLIINAFLWLLDLALGQNGLQWAYWITAAWGFALLFHVLAWLIDGRDFEGRRAQHYLDQGRHET
jgi:hypothetical protein